MCKREEDRIYEMFKNGIDEVAFKSIEEDDLDSIQTYINIMEKVNQLSYKVYASLNGVDSCVINGPIPIISGCNSCKNLKSLNKFSVV